MKKVCILLCVTLIFASLIGCNSTRKGDDPTTTESSTTEAVPKPVNFTDADIEKMSNFMNKGRSAFSGAWIYGVSFKKNGNGVFSKIKTDGSEQNVLADDVPYYITVSGGWLYYYGYDRSTEQGTINRIRLTGEDRKILVKEPEKPFYIDEMFVHNNYVYYTIVDEQSKSKPIGRFMRRDADGKNPVKILNKAVYFPYIIGDKLYYQDDNDYCRIHSCDLDGTNDNVFINEWVYQYIYDGKYFYYLTLEDKSLTDEQLRNPDDDMNLKQIIRRCDFDGRNNTTIIDSDSVYNFAFANQTLFYTNIDDEFRLYSYDVQNGATDVLSQDAYIDCISILGNRISYYDYDDKESTITGIYIMNFDGTYKEQIFEDEV